MSFPFLNDKKSQAEKIRDLSKKFGAPYDKDKKFAVGETLNYKGKDYQIKEIGVKVPTTKKELETLKGIFTKYDLLNLDNAEFDYLHELPDLSPYHGDCTPELSRLFSETREKLNIYMVEKIEGYSRTNRLEKPDFLGLYRPYHYWPESWGIYMNLQNLRQEANYIYNYNLNNNIIYSLSLEDAYLLSFYHTYFHELYHHKFELFGSKLELAMRKNVYVDSFGYFYCATQGTDSCLEEAFANVYGLNKSLEYINKHGILGYRGQQIRELLRKSILENAPRGYRVAYEITARNDSSIENYLQNEFLEIILDFTHRKFFNNQPPLSLDPNTWDLYTYRLDPLVNTDNTVTFFLP